MVDEFADRMKKVIDGVKSILSRRGYTITDIKEGKDYTDIKGKKKAEDGKKKTIIARIPTKEVVGVAILREFKSHVEDKRYDHAMLLTLSKYTHYTKSEANAGGIETFATSIPVFDIFKHEFVPVHEFATPEEIEELKTKYATPIHRIPRILVTDPAASMLGAKPGDVLKIKRESATAGEFVAYRYVVQE